MPTIAIHTLEVLRGGLPRRQLNLVRAWAELHRDELTRNWELTGDNLQPLSIDPLP